MARHSFRSALRAFQTIRGDGTDPRLTADLEYLENRDLDLSVRLGALLAFNALMATIGTHPVSASPGAPLSLDAATQSALTAASLIGVAPFIVSSFLCLRALLIGEDFDVDQKLDVDALKQRLFAAFIRSIDAQASHLRHGVWWTMAGGAMTVLIWAIILAEKML